MQCTSEDIEKKRQIAVERLKQKQTNSNLKQTSIQQSSPFKFKSPRKSSIEIKPYTKPIESKQFYSPEQKVVEGKCVLISEDRFQIELTSYSQAAIDIFRTIPSRYYNPKTKDWNFNITDYYNLIEKLQTIQPKIALTRLPNFVVKCTNQKSKQIDVDFSCIDSELANSLLPFQEDGVRFAIDKNGRCLIADDMGLGKTFQALAIASYYKNDWPVLIITTSSMKNVWEETIQKYLKSVSIYKIQYMTSAKDFIGDSLFLIVSYDMMKRCNDKLIEKKFGVLIIDESHTLKNSKAKCTIVATSLAKRAQRVILLSGTPALSRPSELYTQLALIDEKFFGTFFEYSRRYCDGHYTNFGWDANGKSNLHELEIVLTKKFMIRRTKEHVLKSLPNKKQEVVKLDVKMSEFSSEDRNCLLALAAKYQNNKKGAEKHAILLTFFSETARIKIPAVCSYILQMLQTNQKFLVFAHHQIMLDALENLLQKKGVEFIRIDGSTNSERRKAYVDKFQVSDNVTVALLSITAACAGITLTAAKLVIFAELHWNPSILSQAESRAHRIGQNEAVIVRYLIAKETADDAIWVIIKEKEKTLEELGLFKGDFRNATVQNQTLDKNDQLTRDLNLTQVMERTVADTKDISTFFESKHDFSDAFDDDLDEDIAQIDLDTI